MGPMNMGIDPRIALGVQQPNLLNALSGGITAGSQLADDMHTGAYRAAIKEHGAGALQGDQAARNALAGFDPAAMQSMAVNDLSMEQTRHGMQMDEAKLALDTRATEQKMRILEAQEVRAIQEQAAKLSAEERAQVKAEYERSVKIMATAQTPEQWDSLAASMQPELVGKFDLRMPLMAEMMDLKDIIEMQNPKPLSGVGKVQHDINRGFLPAGTPLDAGSAKTIINNNPGEHSELDKELSKKEGQTWGSYIAASDTAYGLDQDLGILGQLTDVAPQSPLTGPLLQMHPGISNSGALFQSIISRVAPSLRVEGSGSTSDIEYKGFLNSLPSLANRPEANKAIIDVLQTKARINQERGDIVRKYQNGEIDQAKARSAIADLNRRSIFSGATRSALAGVGVPLEEIIKDGNAPADGWSGVTGMDGVTIRRRE